MNDCTNAVIRDQLPDLLHERLDDGARAAVMSHVVGCVDCREELRLLREVRAAMEAGVPRVDVNYVIGALPKPARTATVAAAARRRAWADWRVAAAVMLLVAGGSSVAVLRHRPGTAPRVPAVVSTDEAASAAELSAAQANPVNETASAEASSGAAAVAEPAVAAVNPQAAATDVASDASLSNLDETQLKKLLQGLGNLPAVPVADPAPVSLHINAQSSGAL